MKAPQNRGGARANTGPKPKPKATAIAECREELIARLKAVAEDPSLLGKHWIDPWVKFLRSPERLMTTTSGTKLLANLTDMIFCGGQPPVRVGPALMKPSEEPGDSENGEDLGQLGLPPLKPDPAKLVPFKPDNQ